LKIYCKKYQYVYSLYFLVLSILQSNNHIVLKLNEYYFSGFIYPVKVGKTLK